MIFPSPARDWCGRCIGGVPVERIHLPLARTRKRMPTQKFWIENLRHEDEAPLAARLRQLDGVFFAVLNHGDRCAEVDFEDDRVTTREICAVIEAFGYHARLAS
jgi:hypothetical protein